MTNFADELRKLVDEWREKGADIESIVEDLRTEIESLEDL